MKTIIEKIAEHFKVFKGKGVTDEVILATERATGVMFPEQYKEFLKECGVLSFGSHEIFGLGVDGYMNVAETTISERNLNGGLPKDCVVIENLGIDGVLVLLMKDGHVETFQNGKMTHITDSFYKYVELISRQ